MSNKTILESAILINPQTFIDDEYKDKIEQYGCDVLADGVDGLVVDVERVFDTQYNKPTDFYKLIWRERDSQNKYTRAASIHTKLMVIWWPQVPHMIV